MTHFARRLSEILDDQPRQKRFEVRRALAKKAFDHTAPARHAHAMRACRRKV